MKPLVIYLSYFSLIDIKNYKDKLKRLYNFYEMLQYLHPTFDVKVMDVIGGKPERFRDRNVEYIVKKQRHNLKFHIPFGMHKQIIQLQPKYIYLQGIRYLPLTISLLPFLPKTTKLLVQNHAEQPPKGLKKQILKWMDKWVDTYFFSSLELGQTWVDANIIGNTKKITQLVESGTHFTYSHEKGKVANSFLSVGRLVPGKDPLTLIRAFIPFAQKVSDATLTMIYATDELLPEIHNLLKEHPEIRDRIHLVGQVDFEKIYPYYQNHEFFLFGSHYEGGSIALLEAIACGCIPVITNVAANIGMTNQGKNALLFSPSNEKELLSCLFKTQEINKEEWRAKSLEFYHQKMSFEAMAGIFTKAALP